MEKFWRHPVKIVEDARTGIIFHQIMPALPLPDISQITEYLYVSAWPRKVHAKGIRALDVRIILSMHIWRPSKHVAVDPVKLIWVPTIDSPIFPMPIAFLQRGVEAALPVINDGYKVLTHCRYGVHRSVAMACCVLIGAGYSASDAMQLVKDRRAAADPDIWYIRSRILKFDKKWRQEHASR